MEVGVVRFISTLTPFGSRNVVKAEIYFDCLVQASHRNRKRGNVSPPFPTGEDTRKGVLPTSNAEYYAGKPLESAIFLIE